MNRYNQNGSAHVVIISLAVTVLLGAIGFIFWQNFIKSDEASVRNTPLSITENTESVTSANPYKDWKTYTSSRDGYSIKYPPDWFLAAETASDGPYIRSFDSDNSSEGPRDGEHSGYPLGAKYVRVLLDKGDMTKGTSNMTMTDWYNSLGKLKLQDGPIEHLPEDVKELKVNNMQAKSAKVSFSETNEFIYLLHGANLYNLIVYPYGASSDDQIKMILDSFTYL